MPLMSGGDAVVRSLLGHGISTIYCLPGVQSDHLFNAIFDAGDALAAVHTRHEQGAAYMALGAALATGKPAVYSVVPGPGFLNSTAALATAYSTGAPVLALVGQIPGPAIGKGHGLLHEIPDQLGILRTLTKMRRARTTSRRTRPASIARCLQASCAPGGRGRSASRCRPTCSPRRAEVELCAPLALDPAPPLDEAAIERGGRPLGQGRVPADLRRRRRARGRRSRCARSPSASPRRWSPIAAARACSTVAIRSAMPTRAGTRSGPRPTWCSRSAPAAGSARRLGHRRQAQAHPARHRPRRARPHPRAGDRPRRRCGGRARAPRGASHPPRADAATAAGAVARAQGADHRAGVRRAGAAGRLPHRHPRRAARRRHRGRRADPGRLRAARSFSESYKPRTFISLRLPGHARLGRAPPRSAPRRRAR